MAVSDYTGSSPRMQQQPDQLVLNPETGEVELVPGEMQEIAQNQPKQGVGSAFVKTAGQLFDPRKSALPYLLPYALATGAPAAAGGAIQGSSMGSVPGMMSPLPTGPIAGMLPGGVPIGSGLGALAGPTGGTLASLAAPAALPAGPLAGVGPTVGPAAIGSGAPAATLPAAMAPAAGPVAAAAAPGALSRINWGDLAQTGVQLGLDALGNRRAGQASDKALAEQQRATDAAMAENRAAFGPYMNVGGQAANTLAGLSGFSPLPGSSATAPASIPASAVSPRTRPDDVPATGTAQPRRPDDPRVADRATLASLNTAARPQQTQSSFVRMADDDGQIMTVPVAKAAELERMGARRV